MVSNMDDKKFECIKNKECYDNDCYDCYYYLECLGNTEHNF